MNEVESVNSELQKAINGASHALVPAVDKMIAAFTEYKRQVSEYEDLNEASKIVAQQLSEENADLKKQLDATRTDYVDVCKEYEELKKELTLYKD